MTLIETWNSWTTYQKIVFTIDTIVSLPLLPLMAVI